jgi:hypothetical protein
MWYEEIQRRDRQFERERGERRAGRDLQILKIGSLRRERLHCEWGWLQAEPPTTDCTETHQLRHPCPITHIVFEIRGNTGRNFHHLTLLAIEGDCAASEQINETLLEDPAGG